MRKLNILCDMDDIIVSLLDYWLELYNRDYKDNKTKLDIWDYDLWKCVKPECGKKIYDYISRKGFFNSLSPLPGAIEALKQIHADGHDITLVSTPSYAASSYSDKILWVKRFLPFLDSRQDVFLGAKKYLLRGDLLIDDSPVNISKYRAAWPEAKILTIAYPFNEDVGSLTTQRINSCLDTEKAWEVIYKWVKLLSET